MGPGSLVLRILSCPGFDPEENIPPKQLILHDLPGLYTHEIGIIPINCWYGLICEQEKKKIFAEETSSY
jgi:hypothetical protein